MTLRTKFGGIFLGFTFAVVGLFSAVYYLAEARAARQAQKAEQERALERLAKVCREARLSSNPIVAINFIDALKREPAVAVAACVGDGGIILAHTDPKMLGKAWTPPPGAVSERRDSNGASAAIGYRPEDLRRQLDDRLFGTLRQLLLVGGVTAALALLVGLALAWSLTRPIGRLVSMARAIGEGKLEHSHSLEPRQDEIGFLAREMESMARKLKELDELKDEFIANVSHDLRNPMVAIHMNLDYLLNEDKNRDALSPKHKLVLAEVMDSAMSLNVFVSNILDSAKMKAGKMEYHLGPVRVAELCRRLKALYGVVAANQKVAFESHVGDDVLVSADRERLEHILANLVSNALKFTPEGGSVSIRTGRKNGVIELSVEDTGKGIAPDALPALFGRFEQAGVAAQKVAGTQGTGLGLAICKRAIEAMGGSIRVESELGKGTRMILSIAAAAERG